MSEPLAREESGSVYEEGTDNADPGLCLPDQSVSGK